MLLEMMEMKEIQNIHEETEMSWGTHMKPMLVRPGGLVMVNVMESMNEREVVNEDLIVVVLVVGILFVHCNNFHGVTTVEDNRLVGELEDIVVVFVEETLDIVEYFDEDDDLDELVDDVDGFVVAAVVVVVVVAAAAVVVVVVVGVDADVVVDAVDVDVVDVVGVDDGLVEVVDIFERAAKHLKCNPKRDRPHNQQGHHDLVAQVSERLYDSYFVVVVVVVVVVAVAVVVLLGNQSFLAY